MSQLLKQSGSAMGSLNQGAVTQTQRLVPIPARWTGRDADGRCRIDNLGRHPAPISNRCGRSVRSARATDFTKKREPLMLLSTNHIHTF